MYCIVIFLNIISTAYNKTIFLIRKMKMFHLTAWFLQIYRNKRRQKTLKLPSEPHRGFNKSLQFLSECGFSHFCGLWKLNLISSFSQYLLHINQVIVNYSSLTRAPRFNVYISTKTVSTCYQVFRGREQMLFQ